MPARPCAQAGCTRDHVEAYEPIVEIVRRGQVMLARTETSSPFWIEAEAFRPSQEPEPAPQARASRPSPPADALEVESYLATPRKWPRRRREIESGEIVFLRSEMSQEPTVWRFFGLTFGAYGKAAILVEASVPFDLALNPGWSQTCLLELCDANGHEVKLEQKLYPVFPLP